MHVALPVRVGLARSWGWIAFCAVCSGGAVANLAAWMLFRAELGTVWAWLLGATAAALAAGLAARESVPGDLVWNGERWQWAGLEGAARVTVDLHGWMLLRFDPVTGPRRWIAASRRSSSGGWPALRAALYSPSPADPLDPPPP
jgi:hypothetical protein